MIPAVTKLAVYHNEDLVGVLQLNIAVLQWKSNKRFDDKSWSTNKNS